MRITYDRTVDAAYVYLIEIETGAAVSQKHVALDGGEIIIDFDKDGYLLGIEILGANSILRRELLVESSQPDLALIKDWHK